jgi:hypothetical protein
VQLLEATGNGKGARASAEQLIPLDVPRGKASPAASPSGTPAPDFIPLEVRFRQLVKAWVKDTAHLSSTARMAKHPAYRAIIGLGAPAVPLLLAELRDRPDFWFAALREITGENPVPPSSAGKIRKMANAWLDWGREKGHLR